MKIKDMDEKDIRRYLLGAATTEEEDAAERWILKEDDAADLCAAAEDDLIDEERDELKLALDAGDVVKVADALADILYVVYGTADTYGIPIDACFREVHRSNMAKLDENGKPMHSWRVLILPRLDRNDLYQRYRFDEPWNGPNNSQLMNEAMLILYCPSDVRAGAAEEAGDATARVSRAKTRLVEDLVKVGRLSRANAVLLETTKPLSVTAELLRDTISPLFPDRLPPHEPQSPDSSTAPPEAASEPEPVVTANMDELVTPQRV